MQAQASLMEAHASSGKRSVLLYVWQLYMQALYDCKFRLSLILVVNANIDAAAAYTIPSLVLVFLLKRWFIEIIVVSVIFINERN